MLTPTEQMDVKMWNGLAAVLAVVDHHTESTFRKTEVGGDLRRTEEEVAKDRLISRLCFAEAGDYFFGNYKDMDRCLRRNIAESEAMLVAVNHISGDFPVADFLENRLHCRRNLADVHPSGKLKKHGRGRFLFIRLAQYVLHGVDIFGVNT